jgi:hypothetical protein
VNPITAPSSFTCKSATFNTKTKPITVTTNSQITTTAVPFRTQPAPLPPNQSTHINYLNITITRAFITTTSTNHPITINTQTASRKE